MPPEKLSGTFELFTFQDHLHHAPYTLDFFAPRIAVRAFARILAIGGLVSLAMTALFIIDGERKRLSKLSAFISRNKR